MNIGIIGLGKIGEALVKESLGRGWGVAWTTNKRSPQPTKEMISGVDLVFLSIPTLDDGFAAYNYIGNCVGSGKPVVTCEKGALANYFSDLRPFMDRIGYTATVGGGTRMLQFLERNVNKRVSAIHVVVSGTLNFICDAVTGGMSIEKAALKAQELGYAEPEAESWEEVLQNEITRDVPMKIAIIEHLCFKRYSSGAFILLPGCQDPAELSYKLAHMRYHTTWRGGRRHSGFADMRQRPEYSLLAQPGPSNAALITYADDSRVSLAGPGAGVEATVGAMMEDAERLMKQQ